MDPGGPFGQFPDGPLIVSQSARHGRRGLERFVLPKPVVPSEENGLHGCVVY